MTLRISRELQDQFLRHGRPLGLVVGKVTVALGGPLAVEDQGEIMGLALLQDLEEHGGYPVYRVGGKTGGSGQPPDGVEGPVEIGANVDEMEYPGCLSHGRPPGSLIIPPAPPVNKDLGAT